MFEIFTAFIQIGMVAFGGGYAIFPILERELIEKRGWITRSEALEYMTIAQVTPGIIAVNLCTFIGTKRRGPAGGIIATIGFIIPGITFITLVTVFLTNFSEMAVVRHAFSGIKIAAAALVTNSLFKMTSALLAKKNGAFKNCFYLFVCVASFILQTFFNTNPVFIVLGAGLCTLIVFKLTDKSGEKTV